MEVIEFGAGAGTEGRFPSTPTLSSVGTTRERWPRDHRRTSESERTARAIDIPDPKDPPSGCRFHTRCSEAREACRRTSPDPVDVGPGHETACFRELEDHEYWTSEPITDEESDDVAPASPK